MIDAFQGWLALAWKGRMLNSSQLWGTDPMTCYWIQEE